MATGKGSRMEDALWQRLLACEFRLSDGSRLQDRVAQDTALTGRRAEAAIQGYRQFLWLCAQGEGVQVPSPAIDAVWHLHLLDTRAYASFCDQVIGRMIHHCPGRPAAAKDPAYAETRAALARHFGPPDPALWPEPEATRARRLDYRPIVLGILVCLASGYFAFWSLWLVGAALIMLPVILAITNTPLPNLSSFGGISGGGGDSDGCGGCGGD